MGKCFVMDKIILMSLIVIDDALIVLEILSCSVFFFKITVPRIELRGVPATLVWHSGGNLLSERNLLQVNEKNKKIKVKSRTLSLPHKL